MVDDSVAPNPKVRRAGAVVLLLAVLCYIGAATGFDAHGGSGRIVLLVVGTLLLLLGLALIRAKAPAVTAVRADQTGLTFEVGHGRPESIPWSDIEAVWLRQLGTVFRGSMLAFRYTEHASRLPALRVFERPVAGGGSRVLIGLNAQQADAMRTELPTAAGTRYRASAPS
jgi:hypothetical protein